MIIPQATMVPIDSIRKNPKNPRVIKNDKFKKLVQSVKDFPDMLKLRPVVVDAAGMILGGNMRYEACRSAGMTEIPVLYAEGLTEEQKQEFIIKDNLSGEEWDWESLQSQDWQPEKLEAWGLEFPADSLGGMQERDATEKSDALKTFIEAREASRERGQDKGEINFWLCLTFQSWEQKQEFIKQIEVKGVPTMYGMYADGQEFCNKLGFPVTQNTQKPYNEVIDKKLEKMVM